MQDNLKSKNINKVTVAIFAKTPLPGLVKTRLIPALGEKGAATLAKHFIHYTIEKLSEVEHFVLDIQFHVAPDSEHDFWRSQTGALEKKGIRVLEQAPGDLGDRLYAVAKKACPENPVIVIGTDCPSLFDQALGYAITQLANHDVVIVPTYDGGYALLGVCDDYASLFSNMPWSTPSVASTTLDRINALGLSLSVLEKRHDIDEPEDLEQLPDEFLQLYC